MTFEEEIEHVKREHPRVWAWALGVNCMEVTLPKFNDDDEPDYEGKYLTKEERDNDQGNRRQ